MATCHLTNIELRHQGIGPATPEDQKNSKDYADVSPSLSSSTIKATFTGSGQEYFRIWVVNLLLSLVTLGIYSAWATVRNRRYLYGNVVLDGNQFDFHGNPLAILKGRVIAVVVFAAYAFGGDFHFAIPIVALFLMLVAFPWVLVSALRFRLSNTSWKSLRFGFSATTRQAYLALGTPVFIIALAYSAIFAVGYFQGENLGPDQSGLLVFSIVVVIVFFLLSIWLVPVFNYRLRNLIMNHIHLGDHPFTANLNKSLFFSAFLKTIALSIATFIAAGVVIFALAFVITPIFSAFDQTTALYLTIAITYVIFILIYLFPFSFWQVITENHVVSSTKVENANFNMNMNVSSYWILLVGNAVLAVCTLGLAIPWTRVRMIRYKLSCFSIDGDFERFTGSSRGNQSATGDELEEAFDIDFGF
ncbi:MAG: uncharacterized membrane protein YjgN (DUF898 family) [Lysobacterales bacterium]|jgi:uncharacterized membrane protein YjgN (DUF898 family)